MSELRACPFCGKEPEWNEELHVYRCANWDCFVDCHTSRQLNGTKKEQAIWWNTRPLEDALIAENEQIRKELLIFQNAGLEYKKERDALKAKLDAAKEAIKNIRAGYWVEHVHYGATWWTEKQCDEALKQLEAE